MTPTGYRVLWAYAVRSLGDHPRSRGKSRPAVSGEFLHPETVRGGCSLRKLCSSEASAWTAKHGAQHKVPLLVSGLTMTWVQPFKPPVPFICPIQSYSTGQTNFCNPSSAPVSTPLLMLFRPEYFSFSCLCFRAYSLSSFKMSKSPRRFLSFITQLEVSSSSEFQYTSSEYVSLLLLITF